MLFILCKLCTFIYLQKGAGGHLSKWSNWCVEYQICLLTQVAPTFVHRSKKKILFQLKGTKKKKKILLQLKRTGRPLHDWQT